MSKTPSFWHLIPLNPRIKIFPNYGTTLKWYSLLPSTIIYKIRKFQWAVSEKIAKNLKNLPDFSLTFQEISDIPNFFPGSPDSDTLQMLGQILTTNSNLRYMLVETLRIIALTLIISIVSVWNIILIWILGQVLLSEWPQMCSTRVILDSFAIYK